MSSPPIRLCDAGKRFTKYEDAPMLVTAALRFRSRTRRSSLWALRHVDLEVDEGECIGVIGRNGSGKSTMLQLMAGVTAPTEGTVAVRGRIAPLIAVGVGFHPELTGRENVYVNGSILGLTRAQIDERLDAVVEFAEIEGFLDTPVKFYSSGMFVRLGFAVAIHAEPRVLLIDEVLAVGDLGFQWKCFDRMMEHRANGVTIAVVSHNLNAVRRLCDRTMVLDGGSVRFLGQTTEALAVYHEIMGEERELDDADSDIDTETSGGAAIEAVRLIRQHEGRSTHIDAGEEVVVRIDARFDRDVIDPIFGFAIHGERGVGVYSESTLNHPAGSFTGGERASVDVRVRLPLTTGSYEIHTAISAADGEQILAQARPLHFYVAGRAFVRGVADLGATFTVERHTEVTADGTGAR